MSASAPRYEGFAHHDAPPAPKRGRPRKAPPPSEDAIADAIEGSDVDRMRAHRDDVERALREWRGRIGHDGGAVRASKMLSDQLIKLNAAITALAPRPAADPAADPANVKAKAELLAEVDRLLRDAKA